MGNYHHRPIMRESAVLGESADHPFTPDDFVEAQKIVAESIPALAGRSFPYKINGMFSFSVDGLPILGETDVDGLWVAAAVWITNSGGVGKAMAQWMLTGAAEVDMRSLNVNRFLPYQKTHQFRQIACTKSYVEVHDVIHPAQSPSKPRDVRHTPFHARHVALDAEFTVSAGWEIPLWYVSNEPLLDAYGGRVPARTGWGAKHWSRIQGAEHVAVRERVGMFDLSALAVIEIAGRDAAAFVDFVCTNRMGIDVGQVTYTLLCTPNGGIKRDMAVSRLGEKRYWLFTGSGTLPQEIDWLQRLRGDFAVDIRDLSQNYGTIGLFGAGARDVLQAATPDDVCNDAFPFYSWQMIEIGMARLYAQRISYVGELGWELYVEPDAAGHVWDVLWEAGQQFGVVAAGVGAMRSMRCEKGYRLWGSDMHTETNPYEAGMEWLVKLKKGDFVGRDALLKLKREPLERQLVTILIDDAEAAVTGNEPILVNGHCIGQVMSGNFGYSVGKYIAFGYVPVEFSAVGTVLEIEYLGKQFRAIIGENCMFDRGNVRLKG